MHEYTGPQDYFDESYVRQWEQQANAKRPFRIQFFEAFAAELKTLDKPKVLDIGSGPGFLAEYILDRCDIESYHLLDFSPNMLELSRARLSRFGERVSFHQGSFMDEGWFRALPAPFDAIVSLQAIHETRDAARLPRLYSEIKSLAQTNGIFLIADLMNSETKQEEHFLMADEHKAALKEAGFESIREVFAAGDLSMLKGMAS